jgi:hypothetical protein
MQGSENIGQEVRQRIGEVRIRVRQTEMARGSLLTGIAVIAAVATVLLLESIFHFGAGSRTILFWLLVCGFAGCVLWFVGVPALRLMGLLPSERDKEIALLIGAGFPSLRDRLANGLELLDERSRGFYSSSLVDAALQDLHHAIMPLDFARVVSFADSRRLFRIAGVLAGLFALCILLFPGFISAPAYRLWHHTEAFASLPPFQFLVEPGDREVVKGENVRVTVHVEGATLSSINLSCRREHEEVEEVRVLERLADGTFQNELQGLKATTFYSVRSGGIQSPTYRLTVVDRPVVKMLRVHLQPPAYTGLPAQQLDDNIGDVVGLKGTRITIAVETNKPLTSGSLVFQDSTQVLLRSAGTRATGEFSIRKEGAYHLALRDSQGLTNADPIDYAVKVQTDAVPAVTIVLPGMNLEVTEKTDVPLLIRVSDDFGVSRLSLVYRLIQSRYGAPDKEPRRLSIPLPGPKTTDALVPFTWKLHDLNLVPDDVVEYYAEVLDNDQVSGPKEALSERYLLRYPSMDEILAEADREHEKTAQALEQTMKEAEEARRMMEELRQDLQKEREKTDWQDQKKAEELVKKYEEMRRSIEEAAKAVDQMQNQLQKNQLLSPETLEKYQELQQTLQEMNSPELAEALKRLQEAMQQMSPDQLKQALQHFTFSEENFRKSIERTLNLLKRIQIEQKLDEMVKRAEAMAERQEELRRETEARQDLERLARQQEDLQKSAGEMSRTLQELQKKMEEFPGEMPLQEMQQARKDLQEGNLEEQLQEIAEQLSQHQPEQAMQGQVEARQKMQRLAQQMQQAKKGMQENQQRQIMNAMRQVLQDLLEVSKRQEALKNGTQSLESQSSQFRGQAQEQMEAMQDLASLIDRLQRLSNKSFSVSPEMGKSLGEAMQRMTEAMQSLDQRNGMAAAQQQQGAMAALNEAAFQVQNAIHAMMQSGGQGMGMAGFLQRLQQMSARQQVINQQTQALTPQQAAEMARLAGEQGAVRKSLDQLQREASASGNLSRLLGDLRSIAEEMREVQTDLAQGEVNPETMRKQERILSRLLDSQRSTHERDFEHRRKAETGMNILRAGPGALDLSTQEGKDQLRRDLLRALEEGYVREYQDLIRKYFELLER